MARPSSRLFIHPEAHFTLGPSDYDDPLAPWQLSFANGPVSSNDPAHQATTIALSPTDNTGDPEGDHRLGVEYLRWVADNLAGALQRNLILPYLGVYVAPDGSKLPITQDMVDRYGFMRPIGTLVHETLEKYLDHDDSPYNPHHRHDPNPDKD